MKKRLQHYLDYYRKIVEETDMIQGDPLEFLMEMRIQIGFFQHERLIHLIVTVLFALLTILSIFALLIVKEPIILALCVLFFILLVPYIWHYYTLENGVQKLYEYYDSIQNKYPHVHVPKWFTNPNP